MATPTYTHMNSVASQTDAASYTIPALTFTSGRLYLLTIINSKSADADDITASMISHPTIPGIVPWTQVPLACSYTTNNARRLNLLYGLAGSTGSSTTLIDFGAGNTQTGCVAEITEVNLFDPILIDTPAERGNVTIAANNPFIITKSMIGGGQGSLFTAFAYDAAASVHPDTTNVATQLFSSGYGSPAVHLFVGWGTTNNPQMVITALQRVYAGFSTEILGLSGGTTYNVSVTLSADTTVSPSGTGIFPKTLALDANATLDATGGITVQGAATLDADATLALATAMVRLGALALDANATLDAAGIIVPPTVYNETVTLSADASLVAQYQGGAVFDVLTLDANADLAVSFAHTLGTAIVLDADATMDEAVAPGVLAVATQLDADASLDAALGLAFGRTLTLTAHATIDFAVATAGQPRIRNVAAVVGVLVDTTVRRGVTGLLVSEADNS